MNENCLVTEVTIDVQRHSTWDFYQYETHNVQCGTELMGRYSLVAFNDDLIGAWTMIVLSLLLGYWVIRDTLFLLIRLKYNKKK